MPLATRCPHCDTAFRLVRDQLLLSGGWVRCGRCGQAFDAASAQFEFEAPPTEVPPEVQPEAPFEPPPEPPFEPAPEPALGTPAQPADDGAEPAWADEPAAEPPGSVLEGLADSAWLHAEEVDEEVDAGEDTGALSAMPPVAGDSPASALTVPEAEPAPAGGEPAQQDLPDTVLTDGGETGAHEHDAEALAEALPGHAADGRVEPALDPDFEPGFVRQARRRERWSRPWVRAVLGLLLALLVLAGAAQAAWIWRDSLAQRWPALRPALAALCAAAGCRLQPPRRPQDLALDASSMSPDGASGLRLDLRLHNRGAYAVAYPWLQLSLSSGSEADAPLVRKVIAPEQYLRAQGLGPRELRSRLDAGIGAAQELHIRLGLALREGRAASYTVYLFYP